jgi:WD40 repeat protein
MEFDLFVYFQICCTIIYIINNSNHFSINFMPQNNQPNRDALVIGIGQYTDLTPRELPELVKDAEKIAQCLETQGGFRVHRVPATKPNDKEFIDPEQSIVADELKPVIEEKLMNSSSTTVLLFFAGHGLRQEIKENHYEGFLATSEASPDEEEWGVSLQWLRELLDKSPIPQQIVWIDACHSGEFFNFIPSKDLSGFQNLTGLIHDRCFITSARAHEEAYADGLLTKALLETLDYSKQLNPWVDHLTLIELLEAKNQTAVGSQRFVFEKTNKPIILTNKAFDLNANYKNICPFKGLQSFDFEKNPDDPHFFKGRTELTHELLEKIGAIGSPLLQGGARGGNFLAVLGASGNGKSSVVRAGLLYQLRQTQRWQILPVITPTDDPLKALGTVIGMPAAQLTDFINQAQTQRLVLVIDQFEEVFTLCKNEDEREQFFATLLAAVARADNKFCLVVVMRADFLDKCSQYTDLAKKIEKNQIIVTPMTPAELEEAIVAPTQQVGLQIEPKLVSEMLANVKGALGSLPLLQYTLTELWKTCAEKDRLLTFSAYEKLGKITGTLEKGANGVYAQLSPAEQKTAQRIFIELTQLGEGTPDTRRQLSQQDLMTGLPFESAPVNQVIQKLVAANLLVTDKPKEEQVAIVNIAHEALTQHWGQLRGWLDGNRDAIKIQRDIEADAKKWQSSNQSKNALLQGLDLNIAKDYTKTHTEKVPLSTLALDFVQRSVKRQRHYWQGVVGSVLGVILVLAGIAYYANEQRIEADEQAKIAISSRLGAQAMLATQSPNSINGYFDRALLLAAQAFQEINTEETQENLFHVLRSYPQLEKYLYPFISLKGHDFVHDMVISPNGKILAILDYENVILWDLEKQTPIGQPLRHAYHDNYHVSQIAFNFDCKILATYGWDSNIVDENTSTITVWDVKTQKNIGKPWLVDNASAGPITALTLSQNGKKLAINDTNVITLWDVETQKFIAQPLVHNGSVSDMLFIRSNDKDEKEFIIWDLEQQMPIGKPFPKELVGKVKTFSPNKRLLATCVQDKCNSIELWNIDTQKHISEPLQYDLKKVECLKFTSSGEQLLAILDGGIISLWDVEKQTLIGKPWQLQGQPCSMFFSPDGKNLIETLDTGKVTIWNIRKQSSISQPLDNFSSLNLADKMLMTSNSERYDNDNNKIISDMYDNQNKEKLLLQKLPIAESMVEIFKLSPNGKILATVSGAEMDSDGFYVSTNITLWDVEKQIPIDKPLQIEERPAMVDHLVFSPNNKMLATGIDDDIGTVYLWNIEKQIPLAQHLRGADVSAVHEGGNDHPTTLVIFSPDSQVLASTFHENMILWDVTKRKATAQVFQGPNWVASIAFSPDGKWLVAGSNVDNIMMLWNVNKRKPFGQALQSGDVGVVAFTKDSKQLVSIGAWNNHILLWDLKPETWLKKVCYKAGRNFTQEEWMRYFPDKPYQKTCPQYPDTADIEKKNILQRTTNIFRPSL